MGEHLLKNIWFSGTKYSWFCCGAEWNSQWSQFRATAALIGMWFFSENFSTWINLVCIMEWGIPLFLTDLFLASLSLSTSQRQVLSEIPSSLPLSFSSHLEITCYLWISAGKKLSGELESKRVHFKLTSGSFCIHVCCLKWPKSVLISQVTGREHKQYWQI